MVESSTLNSRGCLVFCMTSFQRLKTYRYFFMEIDAQLRCSLAFCSAFVFHHLHSEKYPVPVGLCSLFFVVGHWR